MEDSVKGVFVERGPDNKIKGIYARKQDGYAEEFLEETNSEVVEFKEIFKE